MSEIPEYGKNMVVSATSMNLDGAIEAMRVAIALATGRKAHKVSLIFSGDGVVNGLVARSNADYGKYWSAVKAHGVEVYADEACLARRGLAEAELHPGWQVIKREGILALLSAADLHIRL